MKVKCPHCGRQITTEDEPWKNAYRDFVLTFGVSIVCGLISSACGFGWQVNTIAAILGAWVGSVLAVAADDAFERKWRRRHGT